MALNLFSAASNGLPQAVILMSNLQDYLFTRFALPQFSIILFLATVLTACGGGGGGGDRNNPGNTPADPFANLNPKVMEATFKKLSDERYTGKKVQRKSQRRVWRSTRNTCFKPPMMVS